MASDWRVNAAANKHAYGVHWTCMHRLAAARPSGESAAAACKAIRGICGALQCEDCRRHALAYIGARPPEAASNLFNWTVDLHNAARSNDRAWSYEQALDYHGRLALRDAEPSGLCGSWVLLAGGAAAAAVFLIWRQRRLQ